jgi:hypothetical protein
LSAASRLIPNNNITENIVFFTGRLYAFDF